MSTQPDETIQVWRASLELDAPTQSRMYETLAEDERDRAGSFAFERDRRRFIAARGLLRELLGRRLKLAPQRLRFRLGPFGKPALVDDALRFSLSHSGELALFAFCRTAEIGIDLERVRPVSHRDRIVERYFSETEWQAARDDATECDDRRFFRCWTRKEAWLKARGEGLTGPVESEPADDERWVVRPLDAAPGYVAALAEEAGPAALRPIEYRHRSDGVDAN